MNRLKFSLSSEQLELLLAFENASGLGHLAELMGRDPSVVSRNLQRIAESYPVLKKVKGRWEITPLGVQINQQTQAYLENQMKLFSELETNKKVKVPAISDDSILIVINAQNGLLDATLEGRNNLEAEKNIGQILEYWRSKKRRVVHVKHVSDNAESFFFRQSAGCDFLNSLRPSDNEAVVEKMKSSAFAGTNLLDILNNQPVSSVILVGFTASECIDATARDASAMGIDTIVVGDGTATFDLRDQSGKLIKAERIHKLTLININAFYAKVINTSDILI